MQKQLTISWLEFDVWWKVDFIWQLVMTSSVVRPRRSCKHFPESSLHKNRSWSLFGGLLLVWSPKAFWIMAKPLHLRSMLSESMRCTKNCNSWHWSTGQSQFFCTTMSEWTLHSQCFKSWMNWALKLCLMHCSPDLSPTNYHFFKHLNNVLQRKCFHNQQEAENAFQEFDESQSTDFTLQE